MCITQNCRRKGYGSTVLLITRWLMTLLGLNQKCSNLFHGFFYWFSNRRDKSSTVDKRKLLPQSCRPHNLRFALGHVISLHSATSLNHSSNRFVANFLPSRTSSSQWWEPKAPICTIDSQASNMLSMDRWSSISEVDLSSDLWCWSLFNLCLGIVSCKTTGYWYRHPELTRSANGVVAQKRGLPSFSNRVSRITTRKRARLSPTKIGNTIVCHFAFKSLWRRPVSENSKAIGCLNPPGLVWIWTDCGGTYYDEAQFCWGRPTTVVAIYARWQDHQGVISLRKKQ